MGKRKKLTHLTDQEIAAFLRDAETLHKTICRPLISPACEHYRALSDLNEAICMAILKVTGKDAPWIRRSSTGSV